MTRKPEKYKKSLALIITLILISSFLNPIFARKARAQWVVFDPANFTNTTLDQIKSYGLDAVAWIINNIVIERISASTVNWINSGFKGSPAFVTDPAGYFADLADRSAGAFIQSNQNLNFLCSPIQSRIRLALISNYNPDPRLHWQCTLSDVSGNMEDFLDDFDRGGWDKFFELSQRPQNSPIGAYLMAENDLYSRINRDQSLKEKELNWGRGFLSFKTCTRYSTGTSGQTIRGSNTDFRYNPETCENEEVGVSFDQKLPDVPPKCLDEKTSTPGSVIENQLNDKLGSGGRKLEAADEINEIVSALLTQLSSMVIGGIGKGLRGISQPDPSRGSRSFASELANRGPGITTTSFEGYFGCPQPGDQNYDPNNPYCDRPDTGILNVPQDPSSAGIDVSRLTYPEAALGTGSGSGGNSSGLSPRDADCSGLAPSTIDTMAQDKFNAGGYATFEDALLSLDCDPPGIN